MNSNKKISKLKRKIRYIRELLRFKKNICMSMRLKNIMGLQYYNNKYFTDKITLLIKC